MQNYSLNDTKPLSKNTLHGNRPNQNGTATTALSGCSGIVSMSRAWGS